MSEPVERVIDVVLAVVGFPFAMIQLWLDSRDE
jgi:hypothetical protein